MTVNFNKPKPFRTSKVTPETTRATRSYKNACSNENQPWNQNLNLCKPAIHKL